MAHQFTIGEEVDGSIAVYDEIGIPADYFVTRQEAQEFIDYWLRDEMASPQIQQRTRERIMPLIKAWGAEDAAEFNLELRHALLDIRWAINTVLDEVAPE